MIYYGVIDEIIEQNTYSFNIISENDFSELRLKRARIWDPESKILNYPSHYLTIKLPLLKTRVKNKNSDILRKQEWFKLDLDFNTEGDVIFFDSILSTDFSNITLDLLEFIDGRTSFGREIHSIFSLNDLSDANENEIDELFYKSTYHLKEHFLACYNVGQGNCNAICDVNGVPHLYFDLGGGYQGNSSTYPNSIKLCNCVKPNIILSHWDGDHWMSSRKLQFFECSTWLVPRQKLTADALKTANAINKKGRLLIWPIGLSEININFLKIIKCTGKSKNDSGLGVYYSIDEELTCLLPGDASYSSIPGATTSQLNALVVTHHGGGGSQRAPRASKNHIGVFSYGINNSYRHPLIKSINDHRYKNWKNTFNSYNGHIAIGSRNTLNLITANSHMRSTSNCNTSFTWYQTF